MHKLEEQIKICDDNLNKFQEGKQHKFLGTAFISFEDQQTP